MNSGAPASSWRKWRLPALLALGMCLAAIAGFLFVKQVISPTVRLAPPTGDAKSMGAADAPVELLEYADFGSPACAQFARVVKEQIVPEFVRTGNVRLVYRHLAVSDDASVKAAVAAEAAAEQGGFWPYHDKLFDLVASEGQGSLTDTNFRRLAAELGLDVPRWTAAYAAPQTRERVLKETQTGRQLGIASAPVVFVGGQRVDTAQPYAVFESLITQRLAAAGR